jgi:predicted metal-dependent phosphoesterase TrpH
MVASGLRLDLHNHTSFSSDGLMSPAELLAAAGRNNVDCIAVTDHNTLEGALWALELSQADPSLPRVIPGIEVSTADGDVIGLYVREPIPSGLSVAETMDLIREQDGLVYLPHPYGVARRGTISSRVRNRAARQADLVEVLNGRSLTPLSVKNSARLALTYGKPGGAGSDAHGPLEVGRACMLIERYPSREDLVPLVAAGVLPAGLQWHEYLLNWALQPQSVMTRFRRKGVRTLTRR